MVYKGQAERYLRPAKVGTFDRRHDERKAWLNVFLELLRRRNPQLIIAAIELHQAGAIPAAAYIVDLDAVTRNARRLRVEADRLGFQVFAMTNR